MCKKCIIILLIFMLFNAYMPAILADDTNEILEESLDFTEPFLEASTKVEKLPTINSRAAIVIDRNSNTVLFGKNEKDIRKMASTTKIMTCLLTIENCNLDETIEVSKKAAGTGGSRLGLKTGDKITIRDLLYGLMLCSGNDTAVALAEHIGGSVDGFASLMNKKAKELNFENTNFETPHGLDSPNHYTTAYELALLANHALNNETFRKIVGTKYHTVNINGTPKDISNTNELLGNLNGVYGIKTGFTNGANRCLVTACKRNDLDIICVVLGADTKNFRTSDSIKLIEYAFENYSPVNVQNIVDAKFNSWKSDNLNNFYIIKGRNTNISIKTTPLKYSYVPIKNNLKDKLKCIISCKKILDAPVLENSCIGTIEVWCDNSLICKTDILTDCSIPKKDITTYLFELIKSYKNALSSF